MGVCLKFQKCIKEALRMFHGSFREISRVLQESLKGVACCMQDREAFVVLSRF